MFKKIRQVWRVKRTLRAKLPFDELDRAERALYLRKLDQKTFHPHGIRGVQEAELSAGRSVVFQDENGNIIERSPDGNERPLTREEAS